MRDSRANLKKSLTLVDRDTFLTTLYVTINNFCKSHLSLEHRSGAQASLTPSEVLTLALFGQGQRFPREPGFYRYAQRHLQRAFPRSYAWRRGLASLREIVKTVNGGLHYCFCLDRERPHDLSSFGARLSAKVALHNFCIWFNEHLGRPRLGFADLIDG